MKLKWWERFAIQSNGCWEWLGSCTSAGYGQVMIKGKIHYTHRLFYEKFKGEIPRTLHIDHLCRNPRCCNPAHLEAVTCRLNLLRGKTKVAENTGKEACDAGHKFTPDNTRTYMGKYGLHRQCKECKRIRQLEYVQRKCKREGREYKPRGPYKMKTI